MAIRLTIRRKLFLAFLGVVAVPLALLATLAQSYMKRARSDLDRKFVEESTTAITKINQDLVDGIGRLQQAAERLALSRVVRQPGRAELVRGSVGTFQRDYPEVLGVEILGRLDAAHGPEGLEPDPRVTEDVREALQKLKDDPVGTVAQVTTLLRKRISERGGERGEQASERLKRLLEEKAEEIVIEIRSANAKTIFSNIKNEDASVRDHLRLAMEDYFRRPAKELGSEAPAVFAANRYFLQVPVRDLAGQVGGMMYVELDIDRLVRPQRLYDSGLAFVTSNKENLRYTPEDAARIARLMPPRDVLDKMVASKRLTTNFTNADGEMRVYAQVFKEGEMVAVAPETEIYASLFWFRLQVFVVVAVSILLATALAYYYSGRFVGAVENIKQGVHAISRGEWAHLEKSSKDELGGDLVESVNRMAITLAERTRREEVNNWRRLVRVLSHEINNTLGPVGSVAATIRDRIVPRVADGDASEDLKMASRLIAERVNALTGFISGYSDLAKLPDPERQKVDFNQLVHAGAQMFTEEAQKRAVAVLESYDSRINGALLDPRQIERVVINLVKNAIEAVPAEGGEVSVRTFRPGRGRVELTVEDNGPGIAAEARKNLFVPYFTTKPGGTGIGLALVRQIVLGHGGVVTAEDRPGGGTLMRVVLPAAGGEIS